jgi:chromosome partitioning protein
MRVWSAVSQKGGSGKTTLLVQLSVYAVQRGERVLVVDLDPQESAKRWHSLRGDNSETPAVLAAVPDALPKVIDAAQTLGITLCMVDTAGKTDAGSVAAIRAADLIITPSQPTFFAIQALKDSVDLIARLNKLDQAVCIINELTSGKGEQQAFRDAEMLAEAVGISVAPAYLVHRLAYQLSIAKGKGVIEAKSGPKDARAVKEIEALWAHLNTVNGAA